jgi:exopolyphosphatase / guanosine-5'-triphosphate,3'-diphosphate pyrophosphatase
VSERCAVLDLGSNSFHLLVADALARGRIRRTATEKIRLRLAEPVAETARLGKAARTRAREAVTALLDTARGHGAERVLAVATSAIRSAEDGGRLREQLAADHGLDVRVLDGLEEGYCSLRGMAAALHLPADAALLGLDLGGGSYEVVYGGRGPLVAGASLPLGAAHLRRRLRHEPPRLAEVTALHDEALALLRPVAAEVAARATGRLRAVATAGTIRDLGRLAMAVGTGKAPQRVRGVVASRAHLERAYAQLLSVPTEERAQLPGVSTKRADLLPAGGAVLLATLEAFDLEQLELCDWGLREGVLLDALTDGIVTRAEDATPLRAPARG